ncbi:MAG: hypothetical protein ACKOEG_05400, partial [Chthoniobacterales bacterium]
MNGRHTPSVYGSVRKLIPLFLSVFILASTARAEMLSELSPADLAKLESGENVLTTIDKPGAIWPEVRIYRK